MKFVRPTALVADDEPLLRGALTHQLTQAWPDLEVVVQARNGRDAVAGFEAFRPDICFLDVHMPGLSGVEAARQIGRRAHLVFVTAFDHYAVEAFAQGAIDYLVKPVEPIRLGETVSRLKERLREALPIADIDPALQELALALRSLPAPSPLGWIRAQVGLKLRLIPVNKVDYIQSDNKYTRVAWRADEDRTEEALVRTPLKELVAQLDSTMFVQIHRAFAVNLHSVSHVMRHDNDTAVVHLNGRRETLPVSRNYSHLFRQM